MRLKDYIKDQWVQIGGFAIFVFSMSYIMHLLHVQGEVKIFFLVLAGVYFFGTFFWEFFRKKGYYDALIDNCEYMDKKYLLPETLRKPGFYEGKLFWQVLYDMEKSMAEQVKKYEKNVKSFKEYVEMWIHEVKLPIASLTLMCHNNREHISRKYIEQVNRLDDFADQILYYVRSEQASEDYQFTSVSLKQIVGKVAVKNKDYLLEKEISLCVHDVDREVTTDGKWLEFMLNQIVGNSMKYIKETGEGVIEIYAESCDGNVWLCVKDNGIGIPAKDLSRVFRKSFTGENGRRFAKSTGMGLYIVKRLCDKLEHEVDITSQEGEYTLVRIGF